ncbi:MAG: hypothetical protein Q8P18_14795 [Pseudomonadota bacterium]|nr:hypothetical protein [Pseudomonadota bacterium]
MSAPALDPAALARLRRTVAIVLGTLAVVSLAVAVSGVWPVPWIDELAFEWLGHSTWRLRIVGVFVVLGGGFLLPVLVVAAVVANVWRAVGGGGRG